MEARFRHDFGHVRVHADAASAGAAARWDARAFTLNHNIHFGAPYEPSSLAGEALLAHELTHVVQADAAASNPARPASSVEALEREARQVATAFRLGAAVPPLNGVARGLAAPLRQRTDDDPGAPTFGWLPGDPDTGQLTPARVVDRVELRQIKGRWYEMSVGQRGRGIQRGKRLASGQYNFVVQNGGIFASRHSHGSASVGRSVQYAGQIRFGAPGTLDIWTPESGSYKPANYFARQAGLPMERFRELLPGPGKKGVQLPVFRQEGEGSRGGGPAPSKPSLDPPSRAASPTAPAPLEPAKAAPRTAPPQPTPSTSVATAPTAGPVRQKPQLVTARDLTAERVRTETQVRRMESFTKVAWYSLGAWSAKNALEDAARALNMAAAILARGSPFSEQIQDARAIEATARAVQEYYDSLNILKDQMPSKGDPEWESWYDVQQAQHHYLWIEIRLHDALKSVREARSDLEKQIRALSEAMAERVTLMVMLPTTSLVYAEAFLFADAGRQIRGSLLAARESYLDAQRSLEHLGRLARAAAKGLELRLRQLGTEGVFGDMSLEEVRSSSQERFKFR